MSHLLPVGKKNRNGKVITNHMGVKKLYLKTYLHRLRNRPIKTEFQEIEKIKNNLFVLRLKNCKERKSKPWEMCHLDKVLKDLKLNKARDPNCMFNVCYKIDETTKALINKLRYKILKLPQSTIFTRHVTLLESANISNDIVTTVCPWQKFNPIYQICVQKFSYLKMGQSLEKTNFRFVNFLAVGVLRP